jgi:hypothetical protein
MGIEPTTYSLGSCRSTTELRPPSRFLKLICALAMAARTEKAQCCQNPASAIRIGDYRPEGLLRIRADDAA